MKLDPKNRTFTIGRGNPITMTDCAHIELAPDEQVTFTTPSGGEYDVARKSWGFYATPSLNARLLDHKLRGVLVRGPAAKYYVLLVERGREEELARYLAAEQCVVARWLDNDEDLRAIDGADGSSSGPPLHCMCGGDRFTSVHTYFAPPPGEVRFASTGDAYRRELYRCSLCAHYISVFKLPASFYSGEYVDATYGDGMRATFDKIMALPPERSDNAGRVARINAYAGPANGRTVLDVGSGLCVFLARMKQHGWQCTALDPDERAAKHAREVAGVDAIRGSLPLEGRRFDVVTFNKVLEHVEDPIALLASAKSVVNDFVYVELPDGEAAAREEGFGREEFFVEHFHVFSVASFAQLAERAGFEVDAIERLREPSSKYTLRAFLKPRTK
ncbi:MAG: class I SAM-dependent methyltransferase [Myxococcota bacterium]|nr:class I SAM-dependent methyltransferase [Myxococcota bacterium]